MIMSERCVIECDCVFYLLSKLKIPHRLKLGLMVFKRIYDNT